MKNKFSEKIQPTIFEKSSNNNIASEDADLAEVGYKTVHKLQIIAKRQSSPTCSISFVPTSKMSVQQP